MDIGAVVRIAPIKDIKTLIYAFLRAETRVPQARLHVLGDTDDEEYRQECVDLIAQLEVRDLYLVGNTNVSEYLKKLDFTVLSSISEGQPLAVLESLAARRPCVTTDVGCCGTCWRGRATMPLAGRGCASRPCTRRRWPTLWSCCASAGICAWKWARWGRSGS